MAATPLPMNTWLPIAQFDFHADYAHEARALLFWVEASRAVSDMADMIQEGWIEGDRLMGTWRHMCSSEEGPLTEFAALEFTRLNDLEPTHFMVVAPPGEAAAMSAAA